MKTIRAVAGVFDEILIVLAVLGAILLIFLMLSVSTDVFMRYFLSRPILWLTEVTEYCLLFITFLGTGWVLKIEGHVEMDILVRQLTPRAETFFRIITSLIGATSCLIVTWFGVWIAWDSLQAGVKMTSLLQPPQFVILSIIPLGSFLLFVQFLRRTYKYMRGQGINR